jgi:protein MAK11
MDRLHTIIHPSRLHDVRFCKRIIGEGEVLLVAAEDKKLSIYDISNEPEKIPTVIAVMIGHSNRSSSFYHNTKLLTSLF